MIDSSAIASVAHLARIRLNDTELQTYTDKLSNILSLFEQLDAVDTSNLSPMAHSLHYTQRLRSDEVTEINQRELLQQSAPVVLAGLYIVPQVIEQA